jgi:hypothetical protein
MRSVSQVYPGGLRAAAFGAPLGTPNPRISLILFASWGFLAPKPAFLVSWTVSTQILAWGRDLELKRGRFAAPFWFRISAPSQYSCRNGSGRRKHWFWRQGPPTRIKSDLSWRSGSLAGLLRIFRKHYVATSSTRLEEVLWVVRWLCTCLAEAKTITWESTAGRGSGGCPGRVRSWHTRGTSKCFQGAWGYPHTPNLSGGLGDDFMKRVRSERKSLDHVLKCVEHVLRFV